MAGDAVIGALRIFLGIDTGQLEDGLKKSSNSLNKFARDVAAVGVGVELAKVFEKVVEGFGHLIKSSIETADNMGKLSQKIGIPVESLSSLQVAAKLSDVSIEQLGRAVGRLDKEMVAAAAGGTSDAAAALRYLGITTKDLQGLNAEKTFGKIAESISKMEDGANKTAVVMAIFGGRMGKEIIPLLNMGAKGFEEMTKTAAALGLVISEKTAKQSEKFNDNLKLMGLAVQGVGLTVAKYFLPEMAKSSDAMVKWVVDGQLVAKTAEAIVRGLIFISDNAKILGITLALVFGGTILRAIGAFVIALGSLAVSMAVAAASSVLLVAQIVVVAGAIALAGVVILSLTGHLQGLIDKVTALTDKMPLMAAVGSVLTTILEKLGFSTRAFTGDLSKITGVSNEIANSFKNLHNQKPFDPNSIADAKKFQEELTKIQLKTRELNGDFINFAPGFVEAAIKLKLLTEAGDNWSNMTVAMRQRMTELNFELANFKVAQIAQENLTPWQLYQQEIAKLGAVFSQVSGQQDLFVKMSIMAAAKMQAAYADMAANMIGGFVQLFSQLGQKSKKMFDVWKAFAIAEAIINTYKAANLALAAPPGPPVSFAYVAAAIAAGLANVIKITSTKFTGAAMGGAFKVPGGSMGVDTRMVSMALAPGELVEVTPAAKAGAEQTGYLELSPIRPKDFFTGEMVREMVFSIDQWMRDGGTGVRFANR